MRLSLRCATTVLLAAVAAAPHAAAIAPQTIAADRFVDAVGINVHLHYNGTVYRDQYPLVESRLRELGVHHVRDGLVDTTWQPYFDRHNALGKGGIKTVFIAAPGQDPKLWAGYPARMGETFEAYEGPNEYDKSRDPHWVETLKRTLSALRQLKDDPRSAAFPLYGPSLTSAAAYAALGDVSASFDFANLHNYFSGRHPATRGWGANGYGSISWNLDLAGRYAGGKPAITTETGYQDDPAVTGSVPREIAARYMPRVLLEQFRAGIVRTYIYELADFSRSGSYGLLDAKGVPKPAFLAVKGLLNVLADPGPPATPRDLGYTIRGGTADLHHMAFQKRDGTYLVAAWIDAPGYDPTTRRPVTVAAQEVTMTLPRGMRHVRTHQWQLDGSVSATPIAAAAATTSIDLDVTDRLMMIELTPAQERK